MTEDPGYLATHLAEALAGDSRVGELGLTVAVTAADVYVSGTVSTPERREAVARVIAEMVPGARVYNSVTVPPLDEPGAADAEHLS